LGEEEIVLVVHANMSWDLQIYNLMIVQGLLAVVVFIYTVVKRFMFWELLMSGTWAKKFQ